LNGYSKYVTAASPNKKYVLECDSTQIIYHVQRFKPPNLQRNSCAEQIMTHHVHDKLPSPLLCFLHFI